MVTFRIISKIIGSLLFIEGQFMGWCALMSFFYNEDDLMAFLISLLITFGSGFFFLYLGRNAENSLNRRDAYVVVTAAWVVFS
ncbi:MAG: TrkH family potassium uptake protein, partial [Prevotella sp.]|nr:TrkH family potassium uptake protein [Prevotella sp.]